ncbi:MAG: putative Ig domain-containing protein [Verrucomicrobiota bacterium]
MNVPRLLPRLKHLCKRASSLLMLFQRTPAAQLLIPAEFNLVSSAALLDTTTKFTIATVAGLTAYDSVAGATNITQVSGSLNVVAGQPMSASFQITGTTSPPNSWQIVGTLPAGLSLPNVEGNPATLFGTTTEVGSKTVSLRAYQDLNFGGNEYQKNITINVSAPAMAAVINSPASVTINSGQSTMLTVLAAGQGQLTYQWYQGNTGVTTTPVGTNSSSFTTPVLTSTTRYWVKVSNAANPGGASSDTAIVTVRQPAVITSQPVPITIFTTETTTLSVTATGEAPLFYQWYQGTSGNTTTPVGTNSRFFTTPSLLVTTSYWVKVSNAANVLGVFSSTATVTVEMASDPTIRTEPILPPARTNLPYSTLLRAVGGRQPYTWTILEGDLPENMFLSEGGVISGTSSSIGTSTVNVQLTDGDAKTDTRTFTLEISDLNIDTTSLPAGTHGKAYSTTLTASGGGEPYTWSFPAETLPPLGLTLSPEGLLSGIPNAAGNINVEIEVADANGFTVSKTLALQVAPSDLSILTAALPTAVKGMAYSASLAASGGDGTYTWQVLAGPLPTGVTLTTAGVLSGIPTAAGGAMVMVQVTDGAGVILSRTLPLPFSEKAVKPIVNAVQFPVITVGTTFNQTVTAQYHPKTFTITGLPKGLKAAPSGAITGIPDVSGIFNVQIRATNGAGSSTVVTAKLTVKALPKNWVGTFGGIIARHSSTNRNLGGQFSLTITTTGSYSLKITGALPNTKVAQGALAITSISGRVVASAPSIITIPVLAGAAVNLNIDSEDGDVSGTVGDAAVTGWRSAWNVVTEPAEHLAGYYSMALDLTDPGDFLMSNIPQGSGFATFSVSSGGTYAITGKTADGESITSAGFVSKGGDLWLCASLNKGLGSVQGTPELEEDAQGLFAGNVIEGQVTWLRPSIITSTLYPGGFGPLNLAVEGAYLAPSNKGFIILGLPDAGTTQLEFTDGGLALSNTDPDMLFTYTDDNKIVPPVASANPGKVTVTLSATTGAMAGTFSLLEPSGFARNKVPFTGQIVRMGNNNLHAAGYFLLPQIPVGNQKPTTAPVLSGGVQIKSGEPG